jgi:O-antigen ligase
MSIKRIFLLIIWTLPLWGFSFLNVGGRGLRLDWLLIMILIGLFIFTLRFDRISFSVVLINIAVILSALVPLFSGSSNRIADFFTSWVQLVLSTLMFLIVVKGKYNRSDLELFLKGFIYTGLIAALLAVAQLIASAFDVNLQLTFSNVGRIQPHSGYEEVTQQFLRSTSFFSEPRQLGAFLTSRFNMVLMLLVCGPKNLFKRQITLWFIFVVLIAGIISTFSSSTYMLALIMFFLIVIFFGKFTKKMIISGLVVIIIVSSFALMMNNRIGEVMQQRLRFIKRIKLIPQYILKQSHRKSGILLYVSNIMLAYKSWKQSPVVGVGLNNLYYYRTDSRSTGAHPPFRWVAETGLLGAGALLYFILLVLKRFLRVLKRNPKEDIINWSKLGIVFLLQPILLSLGSLYPYISTFFWVEISMAVIIYYYCFQQVCIADQKESA